ncbi:glycosyltransferase [Maribacter orientalis]|uniref:Glycosyltransferase n=1 Tax=Maribacter orientalis TaxID=228957 RepID=A0A1H7N901_9FLAO|nr:glycosyltransferase family 2 protein [Maribacter orientalis]SEL20072.1 glycosyltransferase [Maribacter orientalis]
MKVTIITATYNSEETLSMALNSVKEQDYKNIEHVFVDGASTDGTLDIIKEMSLQNPQIKYISESDEGIYDAINKGLNMATGDIIGFVHSDDFLSNPNIISDIVELFKKGNYTGVYGNLLYVDKLDTTKVIRNWESNVFHFKLLQRGWMPAHPTLFLKKEVYTECGNFDKSYKIAADYDFMLRVLRKSEYKFGFLPQVITKMRMGGASNKRIANLILKSQEDFRAMKTNDLKNPLAVLFLKNFSKLKQFI